MDEVIRPEDRVKRQITAAKGKADRDERVAFIIVLDVLVRVIHEAMPETMDRVLRERRLEFQSLETGRSQPGYRAQTPAERRAVQILEIAMGRDDPKPKSPRS